MYGINSTILDLITKAKHRVKNSMRSNTIVFPNNTPDIYKSFFLKAEVKRYSSLTDLKEDVSSTNGYIAFYLEGNFYGYFDYDKQNREEIRIKVPCQDLGLSNMSDQEVSLSYDNSGSRFYAYSMAASEPDDKDVEGTDRDGFYKLNFNFNSLGEYYVQNINSIKVIRPNVVGTNTYNNTFVRPYFIDYLNNYINITYGSGTNSTRETGWFIYSHIKLPDRFDDNKYNLTGTGRGAVDANQYPSFSGEYHNEHLPVDNTSQSNIYSGIPPLNPYGLKINLNGPQEIYDAILYNKSTHNYIYSGVLRDPSYSIRIPFLYCAFHQMYDFFPFSYTNAGAMAVTLLHYTSPLVEILYHHIAYRAGSTVGIVPQFNTIDKYAYHYRAIVVNGNIAHYYSNEAIYKNNNIIWEGRGMKLIRNIPNVGIPVRGITAYWANVETSFLIESDRFYPINNRPSVDSQVFESNLYSMKFYRMVFNRPRIVSENTRETFKRHISLISIPGTNNPNFGVNYVLQTHLGMKNVQEFYPIYLTKNRMKTRSLLLPPVFSRSSILPHAFTPYRRIFNYTYGNTNENTTVTTGADDAVRSISQIHRFNLYAYFFKDMVPSIHVDKEFHTGKVDGSWIRFSGYHDYWFFMPTIKSIRYREPVPNSSIYDFYQRNCSNPANCTLREFFYKGVECNDSGYILKNSTIKEVLAPFTDMSKYYYTAANFSIDFFELEPELICYRPNDTTFYDIKLIYTETGVYRNYPRAYYAYEPFYPPNINTFNYAPVYMYYLNTGQNEEPSKHFQIYRLINVMGNHSSGAYKRVSDMIYYVPYYPASLKSGGLISIIPGYTLDSNYPDYDSFYNYNFNPPRGVLEYTSSLPLLVGTESSAPNLFTHQYFAGFNPRLWPRAVMMYYAPTMNNLNPFYYTSGLIKYKEKTVNVKKSKMYVKREKREKFDVLFYVNITDEINNLSTVNLFYKKMFSTDDRYDAVLFIKRVEDEYIMYIYVKSNYNVLKALYPEISGEYRERIDVSEYIKQKIQSGVPTYDIFSDIISGKVIKDLNMNKMEILDFPHPVETGMYLGTGHWDIHNAIFIDNKQQSHTPSFSAVEAEHVEEEFYDLVAHDSHTIVIENETSGRNSPDGLFGWGEALYVKYENDSNISEYLDASVKVNHRNYKVSSSLEPEPSIYPNTDYSYRINSYAGTINTFNITNSNDTIDETTSYNLFSDNVYYTKYKTDINKVNSDVKVKKINRYYLKSENIVYTHKNMDVQHNIKNGEKVSFRYVNDAAINLIETMEAFDVDLHSVNQLRNLPTNTFNTNVLLYKSDKSGEPIILSNNPINPNILLFMFYDNTTERWEDVINPFEGFHFMNTASLIGGKMYNMDKHTIMNNNSINSPDVINVSRYAQNISLNYGVLNSRISNTLSKQFVLPHYLYLYDFGVTKRGGSINLNNPNGYHYLYDTYDLNNVFMNIFFPRIPMSITQHFIGDELRGFYLKQPVEIEYDTSFYNYTITENGRTYRYRPYLRDYKIKRYETLKQDDNQIKRIYGRVIFPFHYNSVMLVPPSNLHTVVASDLTSQSFINQYFSTNSVYYHIIDTTQQNNPFLKHYHMFVPHQASKNENSIHNRIYKKVYYATNSMYGVTEQNLKRGVRFDESYRPDTVSIRIGGLVEVNPHIGYHYMGLYSNFIPNIPFFKSNRTEFQKADAFIRKNINNTIGNFSSNMKYSVSANQSDYNNSFIFTKKWANNTIETQDIFNYNKLNRHNFTLYGTPPNGTPLGATSFVQIYWPSIFPKLKHDQDLNPFFGQIIATRSFIPKELLWPPATFMGIPIYNKYVNQKVINDSVISTVYGDLNIIYQGFNKYHVFSPCYPHDPLIFRPFSGNEFVDTMEHIIQCASTNFLITHDKMTWGINRIGEPTYYPGIAALYNYQNGNAYAMNGEYTNKTMIVNFFNINNYTPHHVHFSMHGIVNPMVQLCCICGEHREKIKKFIIPFSLNGYEEEIIRSNNIDLDGFYTYTTFAMARMISDYVTYQIERPEDYTIGGLYKNFYFENENEFYDIYSYENNTIKYNGISEQKSHYVNKSYTEKSMFYAGMPYGFRTYLANLHDLFFAYNRIKNFVNSGYYRKYKKKKNIIKIFFGKKSRISAGITFLGSNNTHSYLHGPAGAIGGRNFSSFLDKYKGEFLLPFFYFDASVSDEKKYSPYEITFIGLDAKPAYKGAMDHLTYRKDNLDESNAYYSPFSYVLYYDRALHFRQTDNQQLQLRLGPLHMYSKYPCFEFYKKAGYHLYRYFTTQNSSKAWARYQTDLDIRNVWLSHSQGLDIVGRELTYDDAIDPEKNYHPLHIFTDLITTTFGGRFSDDSSYYNGINIYRGTIHNKNKTEFERQYYIIGEVVNALCDYFYNRIKDRVIDIEELSNDEIKSMLTVRTGGDSIIDSLYLVYRKGGHSIYDLNEVTYRIIYEKLQTNDYLSNVKYLTTQYNFTYNRYHEPIQNDNDRKKEVYRMLLHYNTNSLNAYQINKYIVKTYNEQVVWYTIPYPYPHKIAHLYYSTGFTGTNQNSNEFSYTPSALLTDPDLISNYNHIYSPKFYRIIKGELVSDVGGIKNYHTITGPSRKYSPNIINDVGPNTEYIPYLSGNNLVGIPGDFSDGSGFFVAIYGITKNIHSLFEHLHNNNNIVQVFDTLYNDLTETNGSTSIYKPYFSIYPFFALVFGKYSSTTNTIRNKMHQDIKTVINKIYKELSMLSYDNSDPAYYAIYNTPFLNINFSGSLNMYEVNANSDIEFAHYKARYEGYLFESDKPFVDYLIQNYYETPSQEEFTLRNKVYGYNNNSTNDREIFYGSRAIYGIPQFGPPTIFRTYNPHFGLIVANIFKGVVRVLPSSLRNDFYRTYHFENDLRPYVSLKMENFLEDFYNFWNVSPGRNRKIWGSNRNSSAIYQTLFAGYMAYRKELQQLLSVGGDSTIRAIKPLSIQKMSQHIFYPVPLFEIRNPNLLTVAKTIRTMSGIFSYTTAVLGSTVGSEHESDKNVFLQVPWFMDKKVYMSSGNSPGPGLHVYKHIYEVEARLTRLSSLFNMLDSHQTQAGHPLPDRAKIVSHGGFPYYEATIADYFACNGFVHEVTTQTGSRIKMGFALPHPNYVLLGDKHYYKKHFFGLTFGTSYSYYIPEPVYTAPPISMITELNMNIKVRSTTKNNFIVRAHRKHLGFRLMQDQADLYWEDMFENTCFPQITFPVIKIDDHPFDYHSNLSHGNTNGGFYAPFMTVNDNETGTTQIIDVGIAQQTPAGGQQMIN